KVGSILLSLSLERSGDCARLKHSCVKPNGALWLIDQINRSVFAQLERHHCMALEIASCAGSGVLKRKYALLVDAGLQPYHVLDCNSNAILGVRLGARLCAGFIV